MTTVAPELIGAIHLRLGLVFPPTREQSLVAGVARAMRDLGEDDGVRLAARALAGDEQVLDALARELTIGETYFFREPAHFELLRTHVFPGRRSIRCWSSACSTGEEAYSLAIAALEAGVEPEIIGTDINETALARARIGRYGAWSFRGVSEATKQAWFVPDGRHLRVADSVRARVRFARGNILRPEASPRGMDLILCRNVLIYFDAHSTVAAAHALRQSLTEDGWLFTGPSDPLLEIPGLRIELLPGAIVHRRGEPVAAPIAAPIAVRKEPPPEVWRPAARPRERVVPSTAGVAGLPGHPGGQEDDDAFDPEAWVLRATLKQERGDEVGALEDLRRALLLDSTSSLAHTLTASSLRRLGDVEGAERALLRARRTARAR